MSEDHRSQPRDSTRQLCLTVLALRWVAYCKHKQAIGQVTPLLGHSIAYGVMISPVDVTLPFLMVQIW